MKGLQVKIWLKNDYSADDLLELFNLIDRSNGVDHIDQTYGIRE